VDVITTARLLDGAHLDRSVLSSAAVDVGELETAYAIQRELTALRLGRGGHQVGWKLGYTSEVMRLQMGIESPNYGPLLSTMIVAEGGSLPAATQPRVEPEIALLLSRIPKDWTDMVDVLDCCESAHAALEVVDSVWADYVFDIEHNTADGSSAAGVVVGAELPKQVLAEITVSLSRDGADVGRGRGSDAGGHPALGLAWLAQALAGHDRRLTPGDIVITGGLTAAVPLSPGSRVQATFEHASIDPVRVEVTA
jgi:2-keto-4-pentenoate hydratase